MSTSFSFFAHFLGHFLAFFSFSSFSINATVRNTCYAGKILHHRVYYATLRLLCVILKLLGRLVSVEEKTTIKQFLLFEPGSIAATAFHDPFSFFLFCSLFYFSFSRLTWYSRGGMTLAEVKLVRQPGYLMARSRGTSGKFYIYSKAQWWENKARMKPLCCWWNPWRVVISISFTMILPKLTVYWKRQELWKVQQALVDMLVRKDYPEGKVGRGLEARLDEQELL